MDIEHLEDNPITITAYDQYQNLAGEIEARDAAARAAFTPEERQSTPPDLPKEATLKFNKPNLVAAHQPAEEITPNNTPIDISIDPLHRKSPSPSKEYQYHLKTLEGTLTTDTDPNLIIAARMLTQGYDKYRIQFGLITSLSEPHKNCQYTKSILDQAAKLPEVQQALKNNKTINV